MKKIFRTALVGSALALCASGTASANQLTVFVTAGQIQAAAQTAFGTNCGAGSSTWDCGVWGVGIVSSSVAATSISTAAGGSPVTGTTYDWVTATFSGVQMWESGGTPETQQQFITSNTLTSGKTYVASNAGGSSLTGIGAMSAGTQLGFVLNFTSTIAVGTPTNITFRLLASQINKTSGLQGSSKNLSSTAVIDHLVLVPEPSSIGLIFTGIAAIGVGAYRRRRKSSQQ